MLSVEDRSLLAFEESNQARSARKLERIRTAFGLTTSLYSQRLASIATDPDAVRAFPQLITRLLAQEGGQGVARV